MNIFVRHCVAHFVTSQLRTSSDVLGDAVRSSGAQANDDRVYANPFALLCRACPSSHISLLALNALTMFPSSGISEHLCYWYVFSGRTLLVGVTHKRYGTITTRCWNHSRHIYSSRTSWICRTLQPGTFGTYTDKAQLHVCEPFGCYHRWGPLSVL